MRDHRPRYTSITRSSACTWSSVPCASTEPSHSTVTISLMVLDEAHVVLHHHQRVLALEREKQLGGALGFLVGHAGHGLVEQQQLGVLHQQHADLQPLLLAMAQVARHAAHAVGQVDGVQHLGQAVALGRVEPEQHRRGHALVGLERELQVLEHAELLEHRGLLELAADAQLGDLRLVVAQQVDGAAEEHRARVGPGLAGDDVHHRGLARAVGADDAAQLAGRDVQAQLVDGLEAVEADAHVFQVQDAAVGDVHFARRGDAREARFAAAGLGLAG